MGYFNFPHTRNYDQDLGWLIKEVQDLQSINVTKEYVDEKDLALGNRITELNGVVVADKQNLQAQITALVNKQFINDITSSDASIKVERVGDKVDLKVIGGAGGTVTKTYVDSQDTITLDLAKSFTTTELTSYDARVTTLEDEIPLKLDRNTYLEKMTLLDQMDATQNKKIDGLTQIKRVSVSTSNWVDRTGYYTQDITVEGYTANTYPIVNIELSDDVNTAKEELAEYGKIERIDTGANKVTVFAFEKPTVAINLIMKGE